MAELKLCGMKAAYEEIIGTAVKRQHEPTRIVGDLLTAEISVGIARPEEFRTVSRAHIIAWRDSLVQRGLGGSTVRHRLASLA